MSRKVRFALFAVAVLVPTFFFVDTITHRYQAHKAREYLMLARSGNFEVAIKNCMRLVELVPGKVSYYEVGVTQAGIDSLKHQLDVIMALWLLNVCLTGDFRNDMAGKLKAIIDAKDVKPEELGTTAKTIDSLYEKSIEGKSKGEISPPAEDEIRIF